MRQGYLPKKGWTLLSKIRRCIRKQTSEVFPYSSRGPEVVGRIQESNTRRNYRERYKHNIQPVLGKMRLTDVKPMYCKMVLNQMEADYAGSTIRQTYIAMGTMFRAALMNDLIAKHPMDGVRYTKPVRAVNDIKYLTVEEQMKFLEVAKRSHNYYQYALILETGLRTGELIGLTWDAINWEKRTLTVNKTLDFGTSKRIGEPVRLRPSKATGPFL